MRALAAVFAREVYVRRLVFPVALAAGFVPLAGSLAYGWSRPDAAEGRILVALVTAAAFALAFALLFGGSVLAGETAEKRISFFFSRPLPAVAIWGGKLLAVLFLTLVPAALALLPAFATGTVKARQDPFRLGGAAWAGLGLLLLLATLFLILGAHAAVTLARLRSPWIALDALFSGLSALGVALSARTLVRDGVVSRYGLLSSGPFWTLFTLVIVFALAATYAQVAVGRTDACRAHGAFSATLWGLVGSSILVLCIYAGWVASARPTHLASIEGGAMAAPRGSWIAAGGPLRAGRGAGFFLVDTGGSRSLRIRSEDAAFSVNGERAAWAEERLGFFEEGRSSDLFVADLVSAKAVGTGLSSSVWSRIVLSPSGRRLAVFDDGTLSAYEISDPSNPRQLVVLQSDLRRRAVRFLDEKRLLLFPRDVRVTARPFAPRELEIEEVSLESKKALVTGRLDPASLTHARVSSDGRYLVGSSPTLLTLHDRKGERLATLSSDLDSPKMRFLSGDRIAVAGVSNGKAVLKIFLEGERDKASSSFELGPAASAVLGGEVAPGRLAVALNSFRSNDERARKAWKLAIVDAPSGKIVSSFDGLVPIDRFAWWFSQTLPPAEAGSPASRLFVDAESRLVRLDPETGTQTVLLGRSK